MKYNFTTESYENSGEEDNSKQDSIKSNEKLMVCRICYESNDIESGSPCKCSGTQGSVHLECLKLWIHHKFTDFGQAYCEICKEKFNIKIKSSIKKKKIEDSDQKLKFRCKICFLYSTLIIFIIITILVFFQLVDFKAKLARSLISVLFCFFAILLNVIFIIKVYISGLLEKVVDSWTVIFR